MGRPNGDLLAGLLMRIDLNADVGESFGVYALGHDAAVLGSVTSANVACGFHAGDPAVIRRTIRLALEKGVAVGAHPGFPDLPGFGRRELVMAPGEVEDLVLYQVSALAGVTAAEGGRLHHVKVHGALYTMASRDGALAEAVVAGVVAFDRRLLVVAPPGSALIEAARQEGVPFAIEAFADRAYQTDGSLVPRQMPGAVLADPEIVVRRVLRLVRDGEIETIDGHVLSLRADTICVHGDTPEAAGLARRLHHELNHAGVLVASIDPGG